MILMVVERNLALGESKNFLFLLDGLRAIGC